MHHVITAPAITPLIAQHWLEPETAGKSIKIM
jgi:hypothetical protein